MQRGDKTFKATISLEDGREEDLHYNVDTFDQAAFLAGVWAQRHGVANEVLDVKVMEVIHNPRV